MTSLPLNTNLDCPCGYVKFSTGSAFSSNGLHVVCNNTILPLLHNSDITLESGDKFVTVTNFIDQHLIPEKISIQQNTTIEITNGIYIVIKDYNNKNILATRYIGQYGSKLLLDSIDIHFHHIIDLYENALIIEIISICDNLSDPCCDRLPSQINIIGPKLLCVPLEQYYVLPTTTTTTTPEPFIIDFITSPTNISVYPKEIATFSFIAVSLYDNPFSYWWERSTDGGLSWTRVSRKLTGESRKIHSLFLRPTINMSGSLYRVTIIDPKIKYSISALLTVITQTTTTTTIDPFNPVTTTLPPCDLLIFGFGEVTTTTTTTTTTTSTTSTTATPLVSTTTSTTTTANPSAQGYTVTGAGSTMVNGSYCQAIRCEDANQICTPKLMFMKPINQTEVLDPSIVGMPYYIYKKNTIIGSGAGGSLDGKYIFFNNDISGNPIYYNGSQYIFWSAGCWYAAGEYIYHTASSPPTDPSVLCSTPGSVDVLPTGLWANTCSSGFVEGFNTVASAWEIGNGYGVYYYHTSLNGVLPPLSGWNTGIGSLPIPTLVNHICTS